MDDPTNGLDLPTASAETCRNASAERQTKFLSITYCKNRSVHIVRSVNEDEYKALSQLTLALRLSSCGQHFAWMATPTNWP